MIADIEEVEGAWISQSGPLISIDYPIDFKLMQESNWPVRLRAPIFIRVTMSSSSELSIRSDILPALRQLFGELEVLVSAFSGIFQMNVILDANVILAEIRWLALKRKKPDARSILFETLECETIKAFAPLFLIEEIEKNILIIAKEDGISSDILIAHWNSYKAYIQFVDIEDPTEEELTAAQDPKDLPYIKLQEMIDAGIYSNDPDIVAMNGRIINASIVARLRDYSRAAAIEYSLKFTGVASFAITTQMIVGAAELVKVLAAQAKRLPPWVAGVATLLVIIALAHPRTRSSVVLWIKSLPENLGNAGMQLLELSKPVIEAHYKARAAAESCLKEIKE